jgi:hypothetical protein
VVDVSVSLVVKGHDLEDEGVLLFRVEAGHADLQRREHPPGKVSIDQCDKSRVKIQNLGQPLTLVLIRAVRI